MSNKKITDLTDIENSLAMSAQVEIAQVGFSFRSTLTKILNLFKADSPATESAKGFIELATQAEVNTGTDTERAITPDKLKNSSQWNTKISRGVVTNTATGGSSVAINQTSGLAVFEDVLPNNNVGVFTIQNTLARVTSMWLLSINYVGAGNPLILYHSSGDGYVTINVANINIDGINDDTDNNISINFILLNP